MVKFTVNWYLESVAKLTFYHMLYQISTLSLLNEDLQGKINNQGDPHYII